MNGTFLLGIQVASSAEQEKLLAKLDERMTIRMMRDGRSASDRRINPATVASRKNNLLIIRRPSSAPLGAARLAVS